MRRAVARKDTASSNNQFPNQLLYEVMRGEAGKNPYIRNTLAFACLEDRERTLRLMDIVSGTVRSFMLQGCRAVDIGAGCGPLSFAFLNAGGGSVTAIEMCPELCLLMERIADRLGFRGRIGIKKKNALIHRIDPMPEAMLVMCEMVGTGLITEGIVRAVQRIRGKVNQNALYLPCAAESLIKLKSGNAPVTDPIVYDRVDFPGVEREGVDAELAIRLAHEGITISGADIDTRLFYPNGQTTGRFRWLCDTYEELLREPVWIAGNMARLRLNYRYGASDISDIDFGINIVQ